MKNEGIDIQLNDSLRSALKSINNISKKFKISKEKGANLMIDYLILLKLNPISRK